MSLDWHAIPSDHPGWDDLIDGLRKVTEKHPDGHDCGVCREWRAEQELEAQVREMREERNRRAA